MTNHAELMEKMRKIHIRRHPDLDKGTACCDCMYLSAYDATKSERNILAKALMNVDWIRSEKGMSEESWLDLQGRAEEICKVIKEEQ